MSIFNFNKSIGLFVKKAILIILLVGIIFSSLNVVYGILYSKRNSNNSNDLNKFKNISNDLQVTNTGSSHGFFGFDYENYNNINSFNFALVSQHLSYDYKIVDFYKDKLSENGAMLIPISYFSLITDKEENATNFESKNRRYYSFLDSNHIKKFNDINSIKYKYFPLLTKEFPNLLQNVAAKIMPKIRKKETKKSIIYSNEEMKVDAKKAVERHLSQYIDNNDKYSINEEELDSLYKIIELCKSKNIRPVLITTPFTDEYNKFVPDKFLNLQNKAIEDITKKMDVEYYDYSSDKRFWNNYKLFMNADHLNDDGAKKFTQIVFEEILHIKK